jgi:Methyltransferase domain
MSKPVSCNICNSEANHLFQKVLLNKYNIDFFQCDKCKFIQSETPFWLEEAYGSAIADLDIGLIFRNNFWAPIVERIIRKNYNSEGDFVDFGGGYGLFVRLMRDRGVNFYRQDIYCDNIFAKHFDINDIELNTKFELLTAFEVFEHLTDPIKEITEMFKFSNSVLFSTELQPSEFKEKITKRKLMDWHYFTPETGQHISLYHLDTLKYIANKLGKNLYSDGQNLHLLTDRKVSNFEFNLLKFNRYLTGFKNLLLPKTKKDSLLKYDYEFIKNKA